MKERIKTRIAPDLLDTIGRSFKFRHGKGVAEWLKNSLDAYLRSVAIGNESLSGQWPVLVSIMDGPRGKQGPNLAVIDFCGTSFAELEEFFLHWGDTTAATYGGKVEGGDLTGGHGNGGKFYMREMWKRGARFMTWKEGHLSGLVVDKEKKGTTGYWEHKNEKCADWRRAFELALGEKEGLINPDYLLSHLEGSEPRLVEELDEEKRGISIVVGRAARQVLSSNDLVSGKKWRTNQLVDAIRDASQARRPIRELRVSVFVNRQLRVRALASRKFSEDIAWPAQSIDIPGNVISSDQELIGKLVIRKASEQLVGRLKDQNGLLILDQNKNPVAWYPAQQLSVPLTPNLRFINAEAEFDFPEFKNCIQNDREQLIPSEITTLLLDCISEHITNRLNQIEEAERNKRKSANLESAVLLNDSLNKHARKFLQRLEADIFVDYIEDEEEGGGPGEEGTGTGVSGGGNGRGDGPGSGGSKGDGGTGTTLGTSTKIRRPKFPQVLISSIDADPANVEGDTKRLTSLHPPLFQDDSDRLFNCWWINADHPFAEKALELGGAQGKLFRSHQLFMFRDVVQREAMRMLQRREAEMAIDRLETELDEISNRFLGELPINVLGVFLKSN